MKIDHLSLTKMMIENSVKEGDCVCDMTLGNGHDMRLLLDQIGPSGVLHGFDIQSDAIQRCARIVDTDYSDFSVYLHNTSHTQIETLALQFSCIVYNLGYLPGGDKTQMTHPKETFVSVMSALNSLADEGVLLLTGYGGHDANAEREIILHNASYLTGVEVYHFEKVGPHPYAPNTLVFQKKGTK